MLLQLIEKLINKLLKNVEKAAAVTAAHSQLMQAHTGGENAAVVVAAAAFYSFCRNIVEKKQIECGVEKHVEPLSHKRKYGK